MQIFEQKLNVMFERFLYAAGFLREVLEFISHSIRFKFFEYYYK